MELKDILEETQKVQKNMEELQKKLESEEISVTSDKGNVMVKITGNNKLTALTIDESLKNGSTEELQKTILTTIQKGIDASREKNQEAMKEITAMLSLPTLDEIEALAQKAPKG